MSGSGRAPARVALVGNPSDGYGGVVVARTVDALGARVDIADAAAGPSEGLDPGLLALVEAADTAFAEQRRRRGRAAVEPIDPTRWRVGTTVPREVGLAGSSAVVIAALRALGEHHDDPVPSAVLPAVALWAETEVVGVTAGPQDRLVQATGGVCLMDFDPGRRSEVDGWGVHPVVGLAPHVLPPLLVAWSTAAAEPSGVVHGDLRSRFEAGDPVVRAGMGTLRGLGVWAAADLSAGETRTLGLLMAASYDTRRTFVDVADAHEMLVDRVGAAADLRVNSAGSGGSVVAAAPDGDPATLHATVDRLAADGIEALVI